MKRIGNFTDFVDEGERRFGDFYKASNCIATLANKVFILTVNQQGDLDVSIEPEALRVAKSPKSEQFGMQQKIIFPYHYKDGELQRYSEEELSEKFPKLMIYLNSKIKMQNGMNMVVHKHLDILIKKNC